MLVRFASLAFRAPDVTLAFVRTLAVNGPTVSVVFCEWGWGWSNLWGDEGADRVWFIRKIFSFFKRKSPLGRFGECPLLMEERTLRIRDLGSAFDPRADVKHFCGLKFILVVQTHT